MISTCKTLNDCFSTTNTLNDYQYWNFTMSRAWICHQQDESCCKKWLKECAKRRKIEELENICEKCHCGVQSITSAFGFDIPEEVSVLIGSFTGFGECMEEKCKNVITLCYECSWVCVCENLRMCHECMLKNRCTCCYRNFVCADCRIECCGCGEWVCGRQECKITCMKCEDIVCSIGCCSSLHEI